MSSGSLTSVKLIRDGRASSSSRSTMPLIRSLAALERRRAELDRQRGAVAAPQRERHARDRRACRERLGQEVAELRRVSEQLGAVPAGGLTTEEPGEQLGGRIQRDHAAV